jgi:4-hydroxybenzoate polyprenyltransferase
VSGSRAGGGESRRRSVTRDLGAWLVYRSDAWGVTFVIAASCLLLHAQLNAGALVLAAAISAMYWLGYAVNDYFDAPTDALDERKGRRNLFVAHPALRERLFPAFASLTLVAIVGVFASRGWLGVAVFFTCGVVMWAYSSPPLRLKHVPGLDLVLHAVFAYTYPYVLCVVLTDARWTTLDGFAAVILFLFSLGGQLEQQLRDHDLDVCAGGNFTTAMGIGASTALLRVVTIVAVAVSAMAVRRAGVPIAIAPYALLMLPTVAFRLGLWRVAVRPVRLIAYQVMFALAYTGALAAWSLTTGSSLL